MAVRVTASEVRSHFELREWRPASKSARGFDWALLLTAGQARLNTSHENLQVLAPAFVWMPAASVERLAVEAGGSGHLLSARRDLIEQTIRQMPEGAELMGLLVAEQPLVLPIEPPSEAVVARILALVASELHDPKPGVETLVGAALVICLVQLWRQLGASAMSLGVSVAQPHS